MSVKSVIQDLQCGGADRQVLDIGHWAKHEVQSTAIQIHSEDSIRSPAANLLSAKYDVCSILCDAQGMVGRISCNCERGAIVVHDSVAEQRRHRVWPHDLTEPRAIRVDDIEPSLCRASGLTVGDEVSIAIEQEEDSPPISFHFDASDSGIDIDQHSRPLLVHDADLAAFRRDDLASIVADVDDGAAITLSLVGVHLLLTRAVEIHDVNLVGSAIVRERNHRPIAAERGRCAIIRPLIGQRCQLVIGNGANDRGGGWRLRGPRNHEHRGIAGSPANRHDQGRIARCQNGNSQIDLKQSHAARR